MSDPIMLSLPFLLHSRFMIKTQRKADLLLVLLCYLSLQGQWLCLGTARQALDQRAPGVGQDEESPSVLSFGMTFLQTFQKECTTHPQSRFLQLNLFLKRKSANLKKKKKRKVLRSKNIEF